VSGQAEHDLPTWPAGRLDLDGTWELIPGDHGLADLGGISGEPVEVPGLWEAQGHLELDGVAWYRRSVEVADPAGWWTLHAGAVMDDAEVYLNGQLIGSHQGGFTPFDLDCHGLAEGTNEIAIRVTDHPADSQAHLRSAHGKQGWANDVFPSPPSLYATYGGIWQSIWLERHGPARIADAWVNADPDDLVVEVTVTGPAAGGDLSGELMVAAELLGHDVVRTAPAAGPVTFRLGRVDAPLWSPASPVLHEARILVYAGGRLSDTRVVRFGLRTVRVGTSGLELNGEPFKMASALVQGFSARTLYGGQSRAETEAEVRAAQRLGLNTLRLHIKAFDPVYLDVCDELGMLLHCDIPVAEPIAHDELASDGPVAEQCAATAGEQVRRDRGHPSIVMWSAMNELGLGSQSARADPGYAGFARRLYGAVRDADPTRPVIENDWTDPDPAHVYASPLLTAHWYGRLTARYLGELRRKATRWAQADRPLLVSEFGDWGLPDLDGAEGRPFWEYASDLSALIESAPWPGSVAEFVAGTQRYQGLADRFQIELFRQIPGIAGWCVTELTDVPMEFNGLLDLLRRTKEPAAEEIRRATQVVCPMLVRPHWAARAGDTFEAELVIANDGPAVRDAELLVRLGDAAWRGQAELPAHGVTAAIPVSLAVTAPPGTAALVSEVRSSGQQPGTPGALGANSYPVRVVARPVPGQVRVAALGDSPDGEILAGCGAVVGPAGDAEPGRDLLVIGEQSLTDAAADLAASWLDRGGHVLLLAQNQAGPLPLPGSLGLVSLETAWGSTPFVFTGAQPGLAALPQGSVLASELLSLAPEYVYTSAGDGPFAPDTAVGVLKPFPGELKATVIGRAQAGRGLITVCQLPLARAAQAGDPLAQALLGDLLRWARPS
jgi:Glycosyl hydrolases family 2, TIM barrel domain